MPHQDSNLVPTHPAPLTKFEKTTFVLPKNACDTHAHVIGDGKKFPYVSNRSYTPYPASENDYKNMLASCGMGRGVLVQVSVHGDDNSYMLDVLSRNPDNLRGVAVVNPDISDADLQNMHNLGVRAVRINILFGGGVGLAVAADLAARIKHLGWHMEFLIDVRNLGDYLPQLERLPVVCSFDHMGHLPINADTDNKDKKLFLSALENNGWWVKLSGPYRISGQLNASDYVTNWARQIVDSVPERVVWGSDWPHVALNEMPDTGSLRNMLKDWVPDDVMRHKILVDNPSELYDFK